MKTQIDAQTLLGFLSATGLPALFKGVIEFLHPSLYTLACGQEFSNTAPPCYADARFEALLWLGMSLLAIAYGGYTLWKRLNANPTPTETTTVPTIGGGTVEVKTVAKEQQ